MNQAIGMIELKGLASAITIADVMVKSANIDLLSIEKAKGFGWMTVIIEGDVGAVKAAIDAAKSAALENDAYVSSIVIPRPADHLVETFAPQSQQPIVMPAESVPQIPSEEVASPVSPAVKKVDSPAEQETSKAAKKDSQTENVKQETEKAKVETVPEKKPIKTTKKKTPKN